MINEAIILAGGLGTRLRTAVPDLPKCMAPVAGEPFLAHVISYCLKQGITRLVFSLGYKHEVIESFLENTYPDLNYRCSIEDQPLGTGGAILRSASMCNSPNVFVLNGDTLFAADLAAMASLHLGESADCTIALKQMYNTDRYGVVELSADQKITSFKEKRFYAASTINGGIYTLNLSSFASISFPDVFSFEKDFLEKYYAQLRMFGMVHEGYFIDIGIPEDYQRAQAELKS